jgi:hypothetical protein
MEDFLPLGQYTRDGSWSDVSAEHSSGVRGFVLRCWPTELPRVGDTSPPRFIAFDYTARDASDAAREVSAVYKYLQWLAPAHVGVAWASRKIIGSLNGGRFQVHVRFANANAEQA